MTIDRTALRALGQKARIDHELVSEIIGRDCESQAVEMADGIDALLDELDAKDRRIAELEAACNSVRSGAAEAVMAHDAQVARIDELEKQAAADQTWAEGLAKNLDDLDLRLSIATELNVGDRKRIAEFGGEMAERDKAVAQGYLDLSTANQRIHALEAGLREAIRLYDSADSVGLVLEDQMKFHDLRKLLPSEET